MKRKWKNAICAPIVGMALLAILPACSMQLQGLIPTPQPAIGWNDTWTGVYQCPAGVQRPEILQVTRRGRILIATKVNADDCIPAGVVMWEATLAKHVVYPNELPFASNAVIAVSPTQRVRGQLTIVTPDRMIVEGPGRVELVRSAASPFTAPSTGPSGQPPVSTPTPVQPPVSHPSAEPAANVSGPAAPLTAKVDERIRKTKWKKKVNTSDGDTSTSFDAATYGDLDGDGIEEAAVTTTEQHPTSQGTGCYTFTMPKKAVTPFPMPNNPPELGNMEVVSRSCDISGGTLIVVYIYGQAICCPDQEMTAVFTFKAGQWVEDRAKRQVKMNK